jgi:uncharacterized protein YodC (DUF2158 family)
MRPFAEGTVVYLKSGSPPLTVDPLSMSDTIVDVEWFDGAEVKRDSFHKDCLTLEKPQ